MLLSSKFDNIQESHLIVVALFTINAYRPNWGRKAAERLLLLCCVLVKPESWLSTSLS